MRQRLAILLLLHPFLLAPTWEGIRGQSFSRHFEALKDAAASREDARE